MPEPIIEPVADPTVELTTLRQAHSEVLTKRVRDKARIAELETASAALQAKLTLAETAVQDAVVGVPLRHMAESISSVPSLFLETFNKHFKVESKDGKLAVMDLEGTPLRDAKGNEVPFAERALASYLTDTEPESERTKLFALITIASKASGAGGPTVSGSSSTSKPTPKHRFGLR